MKLWQNWKSCSPFVDRSCGEEEERHSCCKVLLWNTHGPRKYSEIREFVSEYDVVILQETWANEVNMKKVVADLSKNFKYWAKNAVEKNGCKKGRPAGGHIIGIKKDLCFGWNVWEWEFGLVLKYNCQLCLISVYNNMGMTLVEKHLKKVAEECMSECETIIVCGDMNARVGLDRVCCDIDDNIEALYINQRNSQDIVINEEGRKVIRVCKELGLTLLNGRTSGDMEGRITYVGGNELFRGSVLDLVLIVDRNNVANVESLRVLTRSESDHLPVEFIVKLGDGEGNRQRARTVEQNSGKVKKIFWVNEKATNFREIARNKINEVNCDREGEIDWDKLRQIISESAEESGMVKKVGGNSLAYVAISSSRFSNKCIEARKEVWRALREWLKDRIPTKKMALIETRKRLKKVIKEDYQEWVNERWEEINRARGMSEWWKAINKFRPKKKQSVVNEISNEERNEHFKALLSSGSKESSRQMWELEPWEYVNSEIGSVEESLDAEIGEQEVKSALGRMANGKATGEDGIPIECLKVIGVEALGVLCGVLNRIWQKDGLPIGWNRARIVPIFKDGNVNCAENYRGVSLLDVEYKVLTSILAERLMVWIEKEGKLKESQAGFRRSRGTRDHLFVLNSLIGNRLKEKRGKLYVAFIDLKAAFDKVDRDILLRKIWMFGIRGKMHETIRKIYADTCAEVQIGCRVTDEFKSDIGVRQGCALSSILFDIFIDDVDEEWIRKNEGGSVIGNVKIRVLKYADDIAIIAENEVELKCMLATLEKYVDLNRLTVNSKKTKIVVFRNGGRSKNGEGWFFKGEKIDVVKEFKYLGYHFSSNNSVKRHMNVLAEKAQKATNVTWGLIKRTGRDMRLNRIYLYNSLVRSIAFYGVEIWGWSELEVMKKVQAKYCKMNLGVARNTPRYIWRNELGVLPVEFTIRERACRYIKDILAMGTERWPKTCLLEEIRAILNNRPSIWGRNFVLFLEETKLVELCQIIREDAHKEGVDEVIYGRLRSGLELWLKNEQELEWKAIVDSSFNKLYKELYPGANGAGYLDQKVANKEHKVIWAKLRCGNIGRAQKKGFTDWSCRLCGWGEETLSHLFCCGEALRGQDEKICCFIQRRRGNR